MTKRILFVVVAFFAGLFFASTSYGQAIGSFTGTVTDKSGSAITGATVTVTSQGTGVSRDTKTDETGHYIINYLPVGMYTIRVEFAGFQAAVSKDNKLQVDESRELDFSLNPASVSSTVEVVADAVAVQTTNPTLGQVITSQQVAQLPLNGRDFVQLATLTPGTTQETNPNSFFNGGPSSEVSARGSYSLSVGGSRANSTDWLLDGNDNNELTAGGIGILSSIDDIQEFKVLTYNYSAEFGTRAGPTVLISTKSGSNDFHGSLFEFLRNTSLDAKSFFAQTPEKFNLNQFGGSVGGPIRKNKTFFFVDGEQKDQLHGTTFTGLVPSDAMRNGDYTNDAFGVPLPAGAITNPHTFGSMTDPNTGAPINSPFLCTGTPGNFTPILANADGSQTAVAGSQACNIIPSNLFGEGSIFPNSVGYTLANLYPHPNVSNPEAGYNFVNSPVRSLYETKFDVRVDQTFSGSDTAFARFSYDQAVSYVPGGSNADFPYAEQNGFASNQGIQNHGRNIAISETHIFSPTMVNQVTGGYNRIFNYITSQGTNSCLSQQLGIPGANINCDSSNQCNGSSCGLVSTSLSAGYWGLGDRGYTPFQGGTNVFSIADSFDMIKGKHDIKMGIGVRANQMNVRAVGFQDGFEVVSGAWTGDPSADLLMGLSSIRIHDQNFEGDVTGRRWKIFRPFVQDDWRVTPSLTLNLGLAWSIATPISEAVDRQANLIPETGQMLVAGQDNVQGSAGVKMDWTAFEPRIGLAYKLFGSDKTVVRAGYAIFHDASWSQGAQGLWQNPPFAAESFGIAFGGCTYSSAACALSYDQSPNVGAGQMVGIADGFPVITSPPDVSSFAGNFISQRLDMKQGAMQQFNLNVERQLPGNVVLTVGYAGSRATHILNFGNNINLGSPSACGTVPGYTLGCGPGGAPFDAPYLQPYNVIYSTNDFGRAHYDSLQIKAETKSSRYGLYALIGYTYSRNFDTGFSDGVGTSLGVPYIGLPNWQNSDMALSQINLNNSFTASVIYDLPFGRGKKFGNDWNGAANAILGNWQVTVIEKITSGFPIFLYDSNNASGVNFNNNGNSYNRPDQVCNPNSGFNQNIGEWFNTSCFAEPAIGELGNAGRTPASGPGFVNTDFSVIKRFALPWENMGLDFRAEFFNLWNHAQFGLPNADVNPVASSQFGKINYTVNNPRLVQFGLKFTF
ncbi:MAG TPA: carboxypeptidase-like regulatory domain-containing protein [Candidatus Eisenbacteria bacterium]|nr:carboxypeptidase-like regulatory domain-containing protein [Candidatus Eisenbacteria bacterium]